MPAGASPLITAGAEHTGDDTGDAIAFEYVVRGVQDGELADIPPTDRSFEAEGVGCAKLEHGLTADYTLVFDRLGIFQQLGVACPRLRSAENNTC